MERLVIDRVEDVIGEPPTDVALEARHPEGVRFERAVSSIGELL